MATYKSGAPLTGPHAPQAKAHAPGKAEKFRKALVELDAVISPVQSLAVREEGGKILLEKSADPIHLEPLTDENQRYSTPESRSLPEPDQDRALQAAVYDFSRVLPANGTIDGDEAEADYADYFRSFESEARRLRVLYEGLQPAFEGGREHDIIYDRVAGTVLKFTKPAKAAYVVSFEFGTPRLVPSLPVEYLERQELHNQIFADSIRFVGMGGEPNYRRIITRQPLIKGKEAGWEAIKKLMVDELGFTKLGHNYGIGYEDSYGFIRDDIAVFDLRPANVFKTESGLLVAIDSIPVRLTAETRCMFPR